MIAQVAAVLAALIYLLPVQFLLRKSRSKHSSLGGFIAEMVTLIPMWLLMATSMLLVISDGAFDDLLAPRSLAMGVTAAGMVVMMVLSFYRFEPVLGYHSGILLMLALHILTLLTLVVLLLIFASDRVTSGLVFTAKLIWLGCALACLAVSIPGILFFLIRWMWFRTSRFTRLLIGGRDKSSAHLDEIATLDPSADFSDLLRMTNPFYAVRVRSAAAARLRSAPDVVDQTLAALQGDRVENALCGLAYMSFTPEEQARLSGPACAAFRQLADEAQENFAQIPAFARFEHYSRGLPASVWHSALTFPPPVHFLHGVGSASSALYFDLAGSEPANFKLVCIQRRSACVDVQA